MTSNKHIAINCCCCRASFLYGNQLNAFYVWYRWPRLAWYFSRFIIYKLIPFRSHRLYFESESLFFLNVPSLNDRFVTLRFELDSKCIDNRWLDGENFHSWLLGSTQVSCWCFYGDTEQKEKEKTLSLFSTDSSFPSNPFVPYLSSLHSEDTQSQSDIFAKKPFKSWNSLAKYYTISHLVRWWVTKIHSKNVSINKNRTRWADKAVHSPFHLFLS